QAKAGAAEAMETLAELVVKAATGGRGVSPTNEESNVQSPTSKVRDFGENARDEAGQGLDAEFQNAARDLAAALTSSNQAGSRGCLVINPCSFVRRMGVEGIELSGLPTIERPVYAADEHGGAKHAVVDVPAFGFVHLTPGKSAPRDKKSL